MKITLTLETQDPAELARVASALAGTVTTEEPAAKPKAARAANPSPAPASQQPASIAATLPTPEAGATTDAVPTEAELTAAANSAAAKLGGGGPAKVKAYIAEKFTRTDGTPAGLKSTADPQKAELLRALNEITSGAISL